MKVILTRDVPKVGQNGEIIVVANGYARNYLFPRQLAVLAKGAALKQYSARLEREKQKAVSQLSTAQQQGEQIRDKQYQIVGKATAHSTRLYGSVTEADIAEAIKKAVGITVDKRRISHIDPIKVTGSVSLTLRLHPDVVVPFSIDVVTEEILAARQRVAELEAAQAAVLAAQAEAAAAPVA